MRGRTWLVAFTVGGGIAYLTAVLAVTIALGEDLPLLGWLGFAVAAAVVLGASIGLAVFLVRSSRTAGGESPPRRPPAAPGVRRVLVVADESCAGEALCRPLAGGLAGRSAEVLVVAPALVSAVHYLDSDLDAARTAAQLRLDEAVAGFAAAGVPARGEVGSESPLEAIADAIAVFAADEIVVVTPPPDRANWLEQDVVERARDLYGLPVSHLVLDAFPPVDVRAR